MLNFDLSKKYDEKEMVFVIGDFIYWPSFVLDNFYEEVSMVTISFDDMKSASD